MNERTSQEQAEFVNHREPSPRHSNHRQCNILLTGGTGFLGRYLLTRLASHANTIVYTLCRAGSETKLSRLFATNPDLQTNVRIVHGDVTLPGLGLTREIDEELRQNALEIFHCAAAYDLAVEWEKARRVNTEGTRNVLDFAVSVKSLRRFHHISTIIVSGDRTGTIYESELDKGQGFMNHYESSKFHAEKEAVKYSGQIPVTIYRPSVIVGNSKDGSAEKFDGPYFALGFMLRSLPMLIPGSGDVPLHLVPVDFVADAISDIARHSDTIGKTFHLCDPNPATVEEFVEKAKELLQRKTPTLHVPINVMRLMTGLPFFSAITKIPSQMISYMYHRTRYDMTNTTEILQRSGLGCPPLDTYLAKMIYFFKANSEHPSLTNPTNRSEKGDNYTPLPS